MTGGKTGYKEGQDAYKSGVDAGGTVDSIVAGTNVTVNATDPANPIVSASGGGTVDSIVAGTNVTVNATDPANPIVSASGGGTVDSIVAGTNVTVDATDPANPIVSAAGIEGEAWAAWAANATVTSDILTNFSDNFIPSSFNLTTGEYTFTKGGRFYVFGGFTWENNSAVGDKSFNTYLRHFRGGVQISAPAIVATTYNGNETRRRQIEISTIFEVQAGDKVFLEVDNTNVIIKGQVRFGGMLLSMISGSGGTGGGNNSTMDITSMTGTAAFSGAGEVFHTRFIAKNAQPVNAMELYLQSVAGGSSLQLGIYDQAFNKIGESITSTPVNGFNRLAISETILIPGARYYASAYGNNNMQVGYKAGAVMAGNGYRQSGTSLPATVDTTNQANIFVWLELLTV